MFCTKCGTQINDGATFCPNCGTPVSNPGAPVNNPGGPANSFGAPVNNYQAPVNNYYGAPAGNAGAPGNSGSFDDRLSSSFNNFTSATSQQLKNVYSDVKSGFEGTENVGRLETDRSLAIYIILSIITCGIYSFFFIYSLARDVNTACKDGQKTQGLLGYLLLSFVTCGIYPLIWEYNLANRLADNATQYGMSFQENGTTVLLWHIFGALICGIGPFVAMNILIKNTNRICAAFNQEHGL